MPHLAEIFDGAFLALVKPQFEAGRADLGKHGIVKRPEAHERVLSGVCAMLNRADLSLSGLMPSPIRGGDGNIEYLAAFSRTACDFVPDIRAVVRYAFQSAPGGAV